MKCRRWYRRAEIGFQCSSASRKFLNRQDAGEPSIAEGLSVLFSEPKIPQYDIARAIRVWGESFSALQRAENSSIEGAPSIKPPRQTFQCSSASRKFLNVSESDAAAGAERFQCSSASRKFLNCGARGADRETALPFSALQRAENSSISPKSGVFAGTGTFSALQRAENSSICVLQPKEFVSFTLSVLFSEPKIPQFSD